MMSTKDIDDDIRQPIEYARDLQLRLYREIGISAVAAALNVSVEPPEPVAKPSRAEIPAVLRGDDLAA
jgi:hypothetical protein